MASTSTLAGLAGLRRRLAAARTRPPRSADSPRRRPPCAVERRPSSPCSAVSSRRRASSGRRSLPRRPNLRLSSVSTSLDASAASRRAQGPTAPPRCRQRSRACIKIRTSARATRPPRGPPDPDRRAGSTRPPRARRARLRAGASVRAMRTWILHECVQLSLSFLIPGIADAVPTVLQRPRLALSTRQARPGPAADDLLPSSDQAHSPSSRRRSYGSVIRFERPKSIRLDSSRRRTASPPGRLSGSRRATSRSTSLGRGENNELSAAGVKVKFRLIFLALMLLASVTSLDNVRRRSPSCSV